jgi:hypothetical protein
MLRSAWGGRNQNRRALKRALAQPFQGEIGVPQRKAFHGRLQLQLPG